MPYNPGGSTSTGWTQHEDGTEVYYSRTDRNSSDYLNQDGDGRHTIGIYHQDLDRNSDGSKAHFNHNAVGVSEIPSEDDPRLIADQFGELIDASSYNERAEAWLGDPLNWLPSSTVTRAISGGRRGGTDPGRLTNGQLEDLARYAGLEKVSKGQVPRGVANSAKGPVYKKGNRYYPGDIDGHKGGTWKVFDRQGRRLGTADHNLRIFAK